MKNRAHLLPDSDTGSRTHLSPVKRRVTRRVATVPTPKVVRSSIPLADLSRRVNSWVLDSRGSKGVSDTYVGNIRFITDKLVWWMRRESIEAFDTDAIREFLLYIRTAHTLPEGRWGEPGMTRADHEGKSGCPAATRYRPVSAGTIKDYRRILDTFCNWLVTNRALDENPMHLVGDSIERSSSIHFDVFDEAEAKAVLDAARKCCRRDHAIACMLLDTGLRASELCGLTWGDIDVVERKATVNHGKGGKKRVVYWSQDTARALWQYGQETGQVEVGDAQVFIGQPGRYHGRPITRSGLSQITAKWGEMASVPHCHPHAFRHTFATQFLLAGGNQIALMELMGHSQIKMTQKYVRYTEVNMAQQARRFSVVARIKKKQ